jgi:hypothetical protein
VGLGIITGAADDDPTAVGTHASAGAAFGPSILWVVPSGVSDDGNCRLPFIEAGPGRWTTTVVTFAASFGVVGAWLHG